jgi:hypothetical protein
MKSQRYKFQALITLGRPAGAAGATASQPAAVDLPPGQLRRMVIRGQRHGTRGKSFFSALVASSGDASEMLDAAHEIVTVSLVAEEPAEYFSVGDHFSLWLGHDVADGVITRRLFI